MVAFLDIHPLTRGHLLVVPRAHSERLEDLDPTSAASMFQPANAWHAHSPDQIWPPTAPTWWSMTVAPHSRPFSTCTCTSFHDGTVTGSAWASVSYVASPATPNPPLRRSAQVSTVSRPRRTSDNPVRQFRHQRIPHRRHPAVAPRTIRGPRRTAGRGPGRCVVHPHQPSRVDGQGHRRAPDRHRISACRCRRTSCRHRCARTGPRPQRDRRIQRAVGRTFPRRVRRRRSGALPRYRGAAARESECADADRLRCTGRYSGGPGHLRPIHAYPGVRLLATRIGHPRRTGHRRQ